MNAAHGVAQIGNCAFRFFVCLGNELLCARGIGFDAIFRHTEIHRQVHEVLLHAIMEIALDPAALGEHRLHHTGAGARK